MIFYHDDIGETISFYFVSYFHTPYLISVLSSNFSTTLFPGEQSKLALNESTTRQAMQLFKETNVILLSSMSSLGSGSVNLVFFIHVSVASSSAACHVAKLYQKNVAKFCVSYAYSPRRSRGPGPLVFFTACQSSAQGRRPR